MRDDPSMRTTLDLDDDVLSAAKALAALRGLTAGQVISELARKGLAAARPQGKMRNGVPLFRSVPGHIITPEMVEAELDKP